MFTVKVKLFEENSYYVRNDLRSFYLFYEYIIVL